jgi:hypothetical protein
MSPALMPIGNNSTSVSIRRWQNILTLIDAPFPPFFRVFTPIGKNFLQIFVQISSGWAESDIPRDALFVFCPIIPSCL